MGDSPVVFEALEERLLLSADLPIVTDISADNRGLVELTVSLSLQASTVNSQTVQVFTAGDDGLLGTPDDSLVTSQVSYDQVNRVIRVNAAVDADQRYKVEVEGSQILGVNECALDGEFNGVGMDTGDGVAGGKLVFFTRPGVDTVVRFTTVAGDIDVEMFPEDTPLTVANFFAYMNRGDWDNTFFHRTVVDFVVQGGGFNADNTFTNIPTDPPVQNEFGISNTRGTIAMAKLGSDPNSATNQWFFNLGDNSENLDNQNSGFTVFGRISDAAGLAVMDALAAYETVDATSQNGAFGDLPVQNAETVQDRDGIVTPSDLVRVSRIARLFEVTGQPFEQLTTAGLEQVSSPGGEATVSVWSLNGVDLGLLDRFLDIRFSGGNDVASIRVVGDIPAPIGIQISGASSVGSIQDRGGAGDNLRFIVSNTSIGQVTVRGSMVGTDLNGVLLSDSLLMPDDVDGDGVLGDNTAIVVVDGFVKSVSIGEDLTGSVVTSEGAASVSVGGRVREASFMLGQTQVFTTSNFRFGEVRNASLETATPISRLQTGEWLGSGVIEAPAITSLKIGGGRDVSGDFEVNLDLSGDDVSGQLLRRASIRGVAVRSVWNVFGDVGKIQIREGLGNWTLVARGDVQQVVTGPVVTSSVQVDGQLGRLRATEWLGGEIDTGMIASMQIAGNRTDSGDLFADVTVRETEGVSIRSLKISGDIRDSDIRLTGDLHSWRLGGNMDGVNMRVADLPGRVLLNRVSDTTLQYQNGRSIQVEEWIGGSLRGGDMRTVVVGGNRRDGVAGDFFADISVRRTSAFFVAGDLRSDAEFRLTLSRMRVQGDVVDSTVVFAQASLLDTVLGNMTVDGSVIGSEIRGEGFTGSIVMGAMFDSTVALGTAVPGLTSFPANGQAFQAFTAQAVIVRGLDDGDASMVNSFILGGIIDQVQIMNPETTNAQPFGVAAFEIHQVRTAFLDGTGLFLQNPTTPTPVGSFEIRPFFVPPDV